MFTCDGSILALDLLDEELVADAADDVTSAAVEAEAAEDDCE